MLSIHRKRNILTKLAQASDAGKAQGALDVLKTTTKGVNFGMPKAMAPPKASGTPASKKTGVAPPKPIKPVPAPAPAK